MRRLVFAAVLTLTGVTGPIAFESAIDAPRATAAASGAVALSEGGNHACGIHADGTLSCWGDNLEGQAEPPAGTFSHVNGGMEATCGVRTNGRLECWGAPFVGGGPPTGTFVDVAVGEGYACGVRTSGRVSCWGESKAGHPSTDAPKGNRFVEVSSEIDHTCARRDDGSLACWGNDFAGGLQSPPGQFTQISAGRNSNCGVLADGRLSCWGFDPPPSLNDAPTGRYQMVSRGSNVACALALAGRIDCWGSNSWGGLEVPPGQFDDVAVGNNRVCATRVAGDVECWGLDVAVQPPQAGFISVETAEAGLEICLQGPDDRWDCLIGSVPGAVDPQLVRRFVPGEQHQCIVFVDGELRCWGNDLFGILDTPAGDFRDAGLAISFGCGLRTSGTISCWGDGASPAPTGTFSTIEVGDDGVCGIRASGTLSCADDMRPAPPGDFDDVAIGSGEACGLRPDATVECWTTTNSGSPSEQPGEYRALDAAGGVFCAIGVDDDRVDCWGKTIDELRLDPPDDSFATLSVGAGLACGLRLDDVVQCWGDAVILGEPFATPRFDSFPSLRAQRPVRILDSRPGEPTFDGELSGTGSFPTGGVLEVWLRGAVPSQVPAVTLSVTVTQTLAPGFATLSPCHEDRPGTSSVNWLPGQTVTNTVLVGTTGDSDSVCVYTSSPAHVVIDAIGYVPRGGSIATGIPVRLADTRPGEPTVDGLFSGVGRLAGGETLAIDTWDRGGVPEGATGAFLNVVAADPAEPGFLTVYACDESRPEASNVNYVGGGVVVNMAFAPLDASGRVCIFSTAATDLVVDVSAGVPAFSGLESISPARLAETRPGEPTIDGAFAGGGPIGAFDVFAVDVTGRAGVPDDAATVMLNVAVVDPDDVGFLTVFPCGTDAPLASAMTYAAGDVRAVAVPAQVGRDGRVCFLSRAATDLVVDVSGFVAG